MDLSAVMVERLHIHMLLATKNVTTVTTLAETVVQKTVGWRMKMNSNAPLSVDLKKQLAQEKNHKVN